jgi:hypothetical protein
MNKTIQRLMAVAMLSLPLAANAQEARENPRGIYKMTTLTGKVGEILAPYDQYKVCTDSITLMVSVNNAFFSIGDNDHKVFNYTGAQPKDENDKSTLIFDSNAKHFSQKWWSQYSSHLYFPNNDWCTEKYESGKYSENGRIVFDALTGKSEIDPQNPLTGTWRIMGYMDELRNVKKEVQRLHEQYPGSKYYNSFVVFSPKNMVMVAGGVSGYIEKVEYDGKNAYKMGNKTYRIKWLSKDRIAIEERIDYRIDWQILERVTDEQTLLSRIASLNMPKRRK